MFAIPGQTLAMWRDTLNEALALGSEHLSCYEVIYEEDTPLYAQLQAGEFSVNEDLACAMYEELLARVAANSFEQYEIANFARAAGFSSASQLPARACRHNVNYWRGGFFYGLGPSAAGYVRGLLRQVINRQAGYSFIVPHTAAKMKSRWLESFNTG